jgi:hypothetical protein
MMGASAIVATVPDATIFKRGRDVAAGIGIVHAKIRPAPLTPIASYSKVSGMRTSRQQMFD